MAPSLIVALCLVGSLACTHATKDDGDGATGDGEWSEGTSFGSMSSAEQVLFDIIYAYRVDNELPAVVWSLSHVARTHAIDSTDEEPDAPNDCNMHSWSDAGPWTDCCDTADHAQSECMWSKPSELTDYASNGFEIS